MRTLPMTRLYTPVAWILVASVKPLTIAPRNNTKDFFEEKADDTCLEILSSSVKETVSKVLKHDDGRTGCSGEQPNWTQCI